MELRSYSLILHSPRSANLPQQQSWTTGVTYCIGQNCTYWIRRFWPNILQLTLIDGIHNMAANLVTTCGQIQKLKDSKS